MVRPPLWSRQLLDERRGRIPDDLWRRAVLMLEQRCKDFKAIDVPVAVGSTVSVSYKGTPCVQS
jgi:hypothetical protein